MARTTLVNTRTPNAHPDDQDGTHYTMLPPEVQAYQSGVQLSSADMVEVYKWATAKGVEVASLPVTPKEQPLPSPVAEAPRQLRKVVSKPQPSTHAVDALCTLTDILSESDKAILLNHLAAALGYEVG